MRDVVWIDKLFVATAQDDVVNEFVTHHRIEDVIAVVDGEGLTLLMLSAFYGASIGMMPSECKHCD